MNKNRILVIIACLLFGFGSRAIAQDEYVTREGTVHITGAWNDSSIVAASKELIVLLNYETAEFELRLDKSTLKTGIDSLDKILEKLEREVYVYEGKMGMDYVQTQKHPPLDFVVEGVLSCSPHFENVIGKGHLEHLHGDFYACMLDMTFQISIEELGLEIDLLGLSDEIQVHVFQTILKRNTD